MTEEEPLHTFRNQYKRSPVVNRNRLIQILNSILADPQRFIYQEGRIKWK